VRERTFTISGKRREEMRKTPVVRDCYRSIVGDLKKVLMIWKNFAVHTWGRECSGIAYSEQEIFGGRCD